MPHDIRGTELKVGSIVMLACMVESCSPPDAGANDSVVQLLTLGKGSYLPQVICHPNHVLSFGTPTGDLTCKQAAELTKDQTVETVMAQMMLATSERLSDAAALFARGLKLSETNCREMNARGNQSGLDHWSAVGRCFQQGLSLLGVEVGFEPLVAPERVGFTFGDAIETLKRGGRVCRAAWNGKGMWLALSCDGSRSVPAENFWSPHNAAFARENGGFAKVLPSITMKTATGEILMGWLASQSDMLANDWQEVFADEAPSHLPPVPTPDVPPAAPVEVPAVATTPPINGGGATGLDLQTASETRDDQPAAELSTKGEL